MRVVCVLVDRHPRPAWHPPAAVRQWRRAGGATGLTCHDTAYLDDRPPAPALHSGTVRAGRCPSASKPWR